MIKKTRPRSLVHLNTVLVSSGARPEGPTGSQRGPNSVGLRWMIDDPRSDSLDLALLSTSRGCADPAGDYGQHRRTYLSDGRANAALLENLS